MESNSWGLGLRPHHYSAWHALPDASLPVAEVLADTYLFQEGGPGLWHLNRIAARTQTLLHSVGLNLGGTQVLDLEYLKELGRLVELLNPLVVSDHLCFTRVPFRSSFDLLPIPLNEVTLAHVANRVDCVQEILGVRLSIENVSSYLNFKASDLTEAEFLYALCERTGCGLLLDLNNLYVTSFNQGLNPEVELQKCNPAHVTQFHIAGHSSTANGLLHDTHDAPVCEAVWTLLTQALQHMGARPVILERDDPHCDFQELCDELAAGKKRCTLAQGASQGASQTGGQTIDSHGGSPRDVYPG